jgi:hypothetical protein
MRGALAIAVLLVLLALGTAAHAQSPSELYTLNCFGCHSPHAEGIPHTVPRLAHSMGYFLRIPEGRAYLVQVPGVSSSALNDEQTARVLNWLLETYSKDELPKSFRPYTADEVHADRHPLIEVRKTRSDLAKRLSAMGYTVADSAN